jgi:lysophospholipase L1-like esterase
MYPDVIDLKPAAVVILAGTNDIARNTGLSTLAQIGDNFQAMTDLAQAHGIKVILCSVTPISDYGRAPQSSQRPPAEILRLNTWLKNFATKTNAVYSDYYSALVDERGMPVSEAAIDTAIRKALQ